MFNLSLRDRAGPALPVLFLVNVLNFYDRMVLGAVLEPLRHEFSLSDTQLGAMVTLFTVIFAVAARAAGGGHRDLGRAHGHDRARGQLRDAALDAPGRRDRRGGLHAGRDEL